MSTLSRKLVAKVLIQWQNRIQVGKKFITAFFSNEIQSLTKHF